MTFLPVIGREIRAATRQSFTYYLRSLVAGTLILTSLFFGLNSGFSPSVGAELFALMHLTLYWAIWILVPLLAADCISRERREGTLGLLFLTPLKGLDIVIAKSFAHGFRALTLWFAVLPVLTVPFLLGGIGRLEALMSLVISSNIICWALGAGILASAYSNAWIRAILAAGLLAFGFVLLYTEILGSCVAALLNARFSRTVGWTPEYPWFSGLSFLTNFRSSWSDYVAWLPGAQLFWLLGGSTVMSLIVLFACVGLASLRTRRAWQDAPPSPRVVWVQRTFFTPVLWLDFFKRWMQRKLERNPVGWLEQRTWSGRLVVWAWLAVIISFYSALLTEQSFFRTSNIIQNFLSWMLAGSMAMGAAASFRRERETGVLELLLVSPINETQVIYGRLRGIWGQFGPTIVMLLGAWLYFMSFLPESGNFRTILFFASTFFTVPIIGLYCSLYSRNFLSAFISTLAMGLFFPLVAPSILHLLFLLGFGGISRFMGDFSPSFGGIVCQLFLAAFAWHRLHEGLRNRSFALNRLEGR